MVRNGRRTRTPASVRGGAAIGGFGDVCGLVGCGALTVAGCHKAASQETCVRPEKFDVTDANSIQCIYMYVQMRRVVLRG